MYGRGVAFGSAKAREKFGILLAPGLGRDAAGPCE